MITIKIDNQASVGSISSRVDSAAILGLETLSAIAQQEAVARVAVGVSGRLKNSIQPSRVEKTNSGYRQELAPDVPYGIGVEF